MVVDPQKLLLVEDDPNDVELIQLAIQELNFIRVFDVVSDGEQAIQYLCGNDLSPPTRDLPRLVLMDLKLPKKNGIEVLQAIRSHPRTRFLPVVIMTSSAEEQDLRACYNLGVNSYVVKALEFQQFRELAQQVGAYWMNVNHPLGYLGA
ncbi:MAG: response regulator [Leptolyngbyaceae cyanobacterium T60_A2020_046]|nr:response regulator [Leptolyngbyaceae cyanobacterium T60_A2020_046]